MDDSASTFWSRRLHKQRHALKGMIMNGEKGVGNLFVAVLRVSPPTRSKTRKRARPYLDRSALKIFQKDRRETDDSRQLNLTHITMGMCVSFIVDYNYA
jgi:hypothetical protein